MGSFAAGLVTGCLLGVSGTFLLLLLGVAFSTERPAVLDGRPLVGITYTAAILIATAGVSHILRLDKDSSMLLLLLLVLTIANFGGMVNGLAASAIAATILSLSFLPPLGSLMVKGSNDRLVLVFFLLIAALGSQMIGRRKRVSQ